MEPEQLQEKDTEIVINENRVGHQWTFYVINYRKYNYEIELFDCLSFLCILIYQHLMHLTIHVLNLYTSVQRYR